MSKLQAQSINRGKLQSRAKSHGHRVGHETVPGPRAESWMCGYLACLDDLRRVIKKAGPLERNIAADIVQWSEDQP